MKYIPQTIILALCLSFVTAGQAQSPGEGDQAESPNPFLGWLPGAFGVQVERDASGQFSATAMKDLPELVSQWYRRNGKLGQVPDSVPIETIQRGDFLMVSIDFSQVWPDVALAKRHIVYYIDSEVPYALVTDQIDASTTDFWTMQLPVPEATVPYNWEVNLADTDRRADLLATLKDEFDTKVELNQPVSGYVKDQSGRNMLLARLLKTNAIPRKHADKMSPMNIRQQGDQKWLTTEVRSMSPAIQFALMPYKQNRIEMPDTILSPNSVWMEWFDFSHRYTFVPTPEGELGLMLKSKAGTNIRKFGFGMEYEEVDRPQGELVAGYSFESLSGGMVEDVVGDFDAKIERGRLVDGLQGKSIYLGYPDRPERNRVGAGITIPEAVRQKLANGHISVSFWYKSPMGQARNRPDNFAWPIGDAMRQRQYVDAGLFNVIHKHWELKPITRGFNAAWQERAKSGPLVPGKWNHLVFTVQELDAANFIYRYEVYVNGVIRTSREFSPLTDLHRSKRIDAFEGPIQVGNVWGTIDNLAIYNYPLGEDEVLNLYSQQLEKRVSYYSCDGLQDGELVNSQPEGNYPEDQILNNRWVKERSFAATANRAKLVPGVKGQAVAVEGGLKIPEKAMWDLSQGAFTVACYFKYTGKGTAILNGNGIRLDINWNKFHGAIGHDWEEKYLGYKESTVEPDVWHHLALTYDRRHMKMYLDGKLLYSRPMINKQGINFNDTIKLGGKGALDEIHFFNYAIDESEVQTLAAHLPTGPNVGDLRSSSE